MSTPVAFGASIWTLSGDPVRMMGIPFSTRMTIVRLGSGELWLHSPVSPTSERQRAVAALGAVAHLVAPNRIHSLGIEPWKALHPTATVWVSPRFRERHPKIAVERVLDEGASAAWGGEIELVIFGGSSFLDEVTFLHRPSRTLIVTDLIQRHEPSADSWPWRLVKRWAGVLGEAGGTSRDLRWTFRDHEAARRSAERILDWDFERLIVAHGACVAEGAKDVVARALAWVRH